MRDPYDVLGVQKNASPASIKSAFRKLAKKLHPDANKNDQKSAAKFAELNAAYEIVGDEDKRKAFDRGEIDAEGKPRFQGFPGGGRGPWGQAGGQAGRHAGGAQDGQFESFTWGPGGFQRHGGGPGSRPARRLWRRRLRRHPERDVRRCGRRGCARRPAHPVRAG